MDFSFIVFEKEKLIEGFSTTLLVSSIALCLSLLLGTIVALCRVSESRLLRKMGTGYVEFLRNIPLLIHVYLFVLGLAYLGVRDVPKFILGSFGLALYTSSFIAEAIRSGITSLPKGQMEAARTSGLTYVQSMRLVVLPQAFKLVVPPVGNQIINLVKNSSILAVIAGFDLTYQMDRIIVEEPVVPVFIVVACMYLLITIPLSITVHTLERKWSKNKR